jgi:hypothetical protein
MRLYLLFLRGGEISEVRTGVRRSRGCTEFTNSFGSAIQSCGRIDRGQWSGPKTSDAFPAKERVAVTDSPVGSGGFSRQECITARDR